MSLQDNNFEQKYLKYKKKYIDLKDMEAGAFTSLKLSNINTNIFNKTPEQLVIANRQKYQDARLAFNKVINNLEDAKLKETFANKAYNKDKNSGNLTNLTNAQNVKKLVETELSNAQKNIDLTKSEYVKSKEVVRGLKLTNAQKAVDNAKYELKLAQDSLDRFKKEEQDRLTKKANKANKNNSSRLLIKDGSPTDTETESLDEEPKTILPKIESKNKGAWKCQENITLDDGYTCTIDGSWDCPNPVKLADGFSCNGVRYTPDKRDLSSYDYLFQKK